MKGIESDLAKTVLKIEINSPKLFNKLIKRILRNSNLQYYSTYYFDGC